MKRKNHMWTKSELKRLIKLWDTSSSEELSKELGVSKVTISQMAGRIRKAGIKLPRKHRNGYIDNLIKEVVKELK